MKVKELIKLLLEAGENEEVRLIHYVDINNFEISEIDDVEYSKPFENHGILIIVK